MIFHPTTKTKQSLLAQNREREREKKEVKETYSVERER